MFKDPIKYLLSDYKSIINSNHDWEHNITSNLRIKLRTHLNNTFNGKCFYCQTDIKQGNAPFEIDHIVHKKKYKYFTFKPENLTLSCRSCNTMKSQKETLIPALRNSIYRFTQYPNNSSDFSIIHAYVDEYDKHIELEDEIFYKAKNGSLKGVETIKLCSLHRLKLAEDKAKDLINELKSREQEIMGLKDSFSQKFSSGTSKEIENFIHQRTLEISQGLEHFTYLKKITENIIVTNISNKLSHIVNIEFLSELEMKKFDYLVKSLPIYEEYINLLTIAENSKSIKKKIINFLISIGITDYDSDTPLLLHKNLLIIIKSAISNKDLILNKSFKIHNEFEKLISRYPYEIHSMQRLNYLIKHYSTLEKHCDLINEILKNKPLLNSIDLLSTQDRQDVKENLNKIGEKISLNPQLYYLTKIDLIHSLKHYDIKVVKTFQKLIKKYVNIKQIN